MSKEAPHQYYGVCQHPAMRRVLSCPITALVVHWAFQGMLQMDRTELLFKVSVEAIVLTVVVVILLRFGAPPVRAVLVSAVISHTVNLSINGQFWVVLKHFGLVKHSPRQLQRYLSALCERIDAEPSIEYAAVYGSLARGKWKATSDLDVRLVRRAGTANGVRACWFVLRERTRAFVRGFPLDVFVLDSHDRLGEMREDEPPVVLSHTTAVVHPLGTCSVSAAQQLATTDRERNGPRSEEDRNDWTEMTAQ